MEQEVPAKGGLCGPKCKARYVMVALASVGMGLIYGLKVGLHVVLVSMVNHTTTTHHDNGTASHCGFVKANTTAEDGPFNWDSGIQGNLLASYFYGYIIAQLPGGWVAERFSAKWVMFFAVAINIVGTLLSPMMAKLHYSALLVVRILQGIGGGVTFPANHVLLSNWAPPLERSTMSGLVYAGLSLGTVIFMLLSGVLAAQLSWEAVFYIEGGFSSIWLVLWAWLIADSPAKQKYITAEEREFIISSINEGGEEKKKAHPPVPWKAIFTSPAFLAILVAHTCSNWGWYMLLIELPSYMKNVLEYDISSNAALSSMPFLINWMFSVAFGKTLDSCLAKKRITTTTARKLATLCASVIPTMCIIALCIVECQREVSVVLMTIAVTSMGGMFCGFLSNHIDIAPNFAGILVAITNTVATIPGIVVPNVVGQLTHKDPSLNSWRIVFYITIALFTVEVLVYTVFGSGKVQPWNNVSKGEPTESQPLQPK